MRRWQLLAAILASVSSGCAAMEDLVLGPPNYYEQVAWQPAPPSGSCGAPPPSSVSVSQTQEPPLLR